MASGYDFIMPIFVFWKKVKKRMGVGGGVKSHNTLIVRLIQIDYIESIISRKSIGCATNYLAFQFDPSYKLWGLAGEKVTHSAGIPLFFSMVNICLCMMRSRRRKKT